MSDLTSFGENDPRGEGEGRKNDMPDFISFGEVLFNRYQDGQETLGGNPLSFAVHMTRLGFKGQLLSAIGQDGPGMRALAEMTSRGIDKKQIQIFDDLPTGQAELEVHGCDVTYSLNDPAAWDRIKSPKKIPQDLKLFYFGTVSQRSTHNMEVLYTLLDTIDPDIVFFDMTPCKEFLTKDIVRQSIEYATILKMDESEIPAVCSMLGIQERGREALSRISQIYNLKSIIITEGGQGVSSMSAGRWFHEDLTKEAIVDIVGAKSALSAGFMATYLRGGNVAKALHVGVVLASYVATHKGSLIEYDDTIISFLKEEGIIS